MTAQLASAQDTDDLVGDYDGGQPEIAAGLRLSADGSFLYGLSYGALDERAQGHWQRDGACAVLTSDPVTPPEFTVEKSEGLSDPELRLELAAPPGIDPQYFDYVLIAADGTGQAEQMDEGVVIIDLAGEVHLRAVRLALPLFDLVSQPFELPEQGGLALVVAFAPNDIGKVPFAAERACLDGDGLRLMRHGADLRFRKIEAED